MQNFLDTLNSRLEDHQNNRPYDKDVCERIYVAGNSIGLTRNRVTWIFMNFEVGDTEEKIQDYLRDLDFKAVYPND